MQLNRRRPSFQKVHYMLRPRKQIERKIIIELLQEIQTKLGLKISDYQYVGLGSIYYYDFILFNKFLNMTDMISLDRERCKERFEFNIPFDFVVFKNVSTTEFLNSHPAEAKNRMTWFDYDSHVITYNKGRPQGRRFQQINYIFEDIQILTRKSKENDIFILTVSLGIPNETFKNVYVKQEFVRRFGRYLSGVYKDPHKINIENYPYIVQNLLINTFRNSETHQALKFRKLFSFCYQDTTPMYTLGGIFSPGELSEVDFSSEFVERDEDRITSIDVPLLTYREKFQLDRTIAFFGRQPRELFTRADFEKTAIAKLGFEIEGSELASYLKFYRHYPQYYEGIV